jgi:hypothetical protein
MVFLADHRVSMELKTVWSGGPIAVTRTDGAMIMKAILPRASAVLSVSLAAIVWGTVSTAQSPDDPVVVASAAFARRDCDSDNGCTKEDDDGCAVIVLSDGTVECHD